MKVCKKCSKHKELSGFYRNKALKDGYENICKECRQEQRKKYRNKCGYCGTYFRTAYKKSKYCSPECKPQSRRRRIEVNCFICGDKKKITPSHKKSYKHFYCSDECRNKGYSLLYSGENHVNYNSVDVFCGECGTPFKRWESQVSAAKVSYCSMDCKSKAFRKRFSRENNPNWDSNKSERERIINRNIEGYAEWRVNTFKRDKFTCQCCGDSKSGNLVAHHIKNYAEYPELRTDLSNSITLCRECHKSFHDTFGYRGNDSNQLQYFLSRHKRQIS